MKIQACLAALALLISASIAGEIRAQEEDHNFVIEISPLGAHFFSQDDGIRPHTFPEGDTDSYGHFSVEWYPIRFVGMGFRRGYIFNSIIDVNDILKDVLRMEVSTNLLTVQVVPSISENGNQRIVIFVGSGTAKYLMSGDIRGAEGRHTTFGTATEAGIFLDAGAKSVGFRVGFSVFATNFDPLVVSGKSYEVDASGTRVYMGIRWAL